jgi:DNA (cytosine-5)-methyltransferase 1
MNVLDLFSGIGGFSLGLERAGMRTVAFCEINDWCHPVLAAKWPNVPIYTDVRELSADRLSADGIAVDLIAGGFPCQDISGAGYGLGIAEGTRSGLWSEYARLIGELRPRFVLVENVSALLYRGMDRVLGDLAALGYDAEWQCISASAVGAPHIRERIWILAYPGQEPGGLRGLLSGLTCDGCEYPFLQGDRWREAQRSKDWELSALVPGVHPRMAADWWRHQSSVARTADGLSGQLDRNGQCGNAVVPQIPEIIGRAIMKSVHPHPTHAQADRQP